MLAFHTHALLMSHLHLPTYLIIQQFLKYFLSICHITCMLKYSSLRLGQPYTY